MDLRVRARDYLVAYKACIHICPHSFGEFVLFIQRFVIHIWRFLFSTNIWKRGIFCLSVLKF